MNSIERLENIEDTIEETSKESNSVLDNPPELIRCDNYGKPENPTTCCHFHWLFSSERTAALKEIPSLKSCVFCVVYQKDNKLIRNYFEDHRNGYSLLDLSPSHEDNAFLFASELIRQCFRNEGITNCDHSNEFLTEHSIKLAKSLATKLKEESSHPYDPNKLLEALKQSTDPMIVQIRDCVGIDYILSLDPKDFDVGYMELLKDPEWCKAILGSESRSD